MTKLHVSQIDPDAPTWESLEIDLPTRYVLHKVGISPSDVAQYQEAGTAKLHQMQSLNAKGITGAKAVAYRTQGIDYETMLELATYQISPETFGEMRKLYPGVEPKQAIRLKRSGLSKSLMAALNRIGITDPSMMERFASSHITAKDLDAFRKAGARPEDFGWKEEYRQITTPSLDRIMLRTLGLPIELEPYLPNLSEFKKSWDDEELEVAKEFLSRGIPAWWKASHHHGEYDYVQRARKLMELWEVAGTEIDEDRAWQVIGAIITIANTFDVSVEVAYKGWKEAGPALANIVSLRSYDASGGLRSMKGEGFEENYPKIINVAEARADTLRWFGPDQSYADLESLIDYSAQVKALIWWWDRFGDHGLDIPRLFRDWAGLVIANVRLEKGYESRNQVYPKIEHKAEVARRIAAKVKLGVDPKVYGVMRELGVPNGKMLATLRASEALDRQSEVGAASELNLAEVEEYEAEHTNDRPADMWEEES